MKKSQRQIRKEYKEKGIKTGKERYNIGVTILLILGLVTILPQNADYCASIFSFSSVRYIHRSVFSSSAASSSACRACSSCSFT